MQTILLDDFIDDGIIKEKSFRAKVDDMDFNKFANEKVIKAIPRNQGSTPALTNKAEMYCFRSKLILSICFST